MKLVSRIVFLVCLTVVTNTSFAVEYITGKVVLIEATYLPGLITFQLDTGNTACPAGTWLSWQKPDTENNLAVYSTLLAALANGKSINFVINDGDISCRGQFLHILRD